MAPLSEHQFGGVSDARLSTKVVSMCDCPFICDVIAKTQEQENKACLVSCYASPIFTNNANVSVVSSATWCTNLGLGILPVYFSLKQPDSQYTTCNAQYPHANQQCLGTTIVVFDVSFGSYRGLVAAVQCGPKRGPPDSLYQSVSAPLLLGGWGAFAAGQLCTITTHAKFKLKRRICLFLLQDSLQTRESIPIETRNLLLLISISALVGIIICVIDVALM